MINVQPCFSVESHRLPFCLILHSQIYSQQHIKIFKMTTNGEPHTINTMFNEISTPKNFFDIIYGNEINKKTASIRMLMLLSSLLMLMQMVRELLFNVLE